MQQILTRYRWILLPAVGLLFGLLSTAAAQDAASVDDMLKEHEQNMDSFLQPSSGASRNLNESVGPPSRSRIDELRQRSRQPGFGNPPRSMRSTGRFGSHGDPMQRMEQMRAESQARMNQMRADSDARMNAFRNSDPFDRSGSRPGSFGGAGIPPRSGAGFPSTSSSSSRYGSGSDYGNSSYSSNRSSRRTRPIRVGRLIRGVITIIGFLAAAAVGAARMFTGKGAGSSSGPPLQFGPPPQTPQQPQQPKLKMNPFKD